MLAKGKKSFGFRGTGKWDQQTPTSTAAPRMDPPAPPPPPPESAAQEPATPAATATVPPAPPAPVHPEGSETAGNTEAARVPIAVLEVLRFPAWLIGDLPLPATIRMQRGTVDVWASWDPAIYARLRGDRHLVLTGDEWMALVIAAEADRAGTIIDQWLTSKVGNPYTEITLSAALGGVTAPDPPRVRWTVRKVVAAWGLIVTAADCAGSM